MWTRDEVVRALGGGDTADKFCALMGVQSTGNVRPEDDPHGELEGQNVLFLTRAWGEWGEEDKAVFEQGRQALRRAQLDRVRPERVSGGLDF